jgi:hypothetical protein
MAHAMKSRSKAQRSPSRRPKTWPPSDKRRLALLNVPRVLFNKALGEAARRIQRRGPRSPWPA